MFQKLRMAIVGSALVLTLTVGLMSAFGQDKDRTTTGSGTTGTHATSDDNDGFDLGWIGLAGLAGLAGLLPRDRRHTEAHTVQR
jgi:hypothetical protein